MAEFRTEADRRGNTTKSMAGLAVVIAIWLLACALVTWLLWPHLVR